MSVCTWQRTLSKTEYLNKTYELNGMLANLSFNIPKAYKNTYLDYAIKNCMEVFEMFYMANNVVVNNYTTDSDFKERKHLLRKGVAKLNAVMANLCVFFDHLEKSPDISNEKIAKSRENISIKVDDIENMVRKVIKYGDECQKKYKEERSARKKENISQ